MFYFIGVFKRFWKINQNCFDVLHKGMDYGPNSMMNDHWKGTLTTKINNE